MKLTEAIGATSTDVANEIVRKCEEHTKAYSSYSEQDKKAATDPMLSATGRQRKRDELADGWASRRESDRRELASLVDMLHEAETRPIDLATLATGSSIIAAMGSHVTGDVLRAIAASAQESGQATLDALERFAEDTLGTSKATAQVAFGPYTYDRELFSEAMHALELSRTRDTGGQLLGVAVGAAVDALARVVLKVHEGQGVESGNVGVESMDRKMFF